MPGPKVRRPFSFSTQLSIKGVRALRGYFGPPLEPNTENCSSQFLLIGL